MVGKFFLVDFVVVAVLRHSRFWAWVSWRTINLNSIYSPACKIPPFWMKEVQRLLQDIGRRDVSQLALSPWASPVVLVRKKVGSLQFSINYCNPNGITRKDAYPTPKIDDTLDTLAGSLGLPH